MSKKVSPALIGSKALDENLTHVLAINCNYGLSNFPAKICHGFTQRGDEPSVDFSFAGCAKSDSFRLNASLPFWSITDQRAANWASRAELTSNR